MWWTWMLNSQHLSNLCKCFFTIWVSGDDGEINISLLWDKINVVLSIWPISGTVLSVTFTETWSLHDIQSRSEFFPQPLTLLPGQKIPHSSIPHIWKTSKRYQIPFIYPAIGTQHFITEKKHWFSWNYCCILCIHGVCARSCTAIYECLIILAKLGH